MSKIYSLNIHNEHQAYFVGSYTGNYVVSRIEQVEEPGQMNWVPAFDIYISLPDKTLEKLWRHVVSTDYTVEYE